jgi:hypothetical protein
VTARAAKLVVVAALAVAAFVASTVPATATNECRGLRVCLTVAGPWVVVAAHGPATPRTEFELTCPRGFIVGGLDAELSDPRVDVHFAGRLGSPVNPGVTTSRSAVFRALFAAPRGRTATFRPRIGCIPASGGGGGIPTARPIYPARDVTTRRVRTVDLRRGLQHLTQRCASGEQLVSGTSAVGFYTKLPPVKALMGSVETTPALLSSAITVAVRSAAPRDVRTVLQIAAVCAGER